MDIEFKLIIGDYKLSMEDGHVTVREGFIIRVEHGYACIECLRCGFVSFNKNDIAQRYCGGCHRFHQE